MKTVSIQDYWGRWQKVEVSDEIWNVYRESHNEVQACSHRETYRRKRVVYAGAASGRFCCASPTLEDRLMDRESDLLFYDAVCRVLTPMQRRRVLALLEQGLSLRELSDREHRSYNSVRESVLAALKKLEVCLCAG